jgi:hypothetical protein
MTPEFRHWPPRAVDADCSSEEGAVTTAALLEPEEDSRVAMLREELLCRDEIIVALQHVIRDLHHELENLRVENRYAVFACEARHTPVPRDEDEALAS